MRDFKLVIEGLLGQEDITNWQNYSLLLPQRLTMDLSIR